MLTNDQQVALEAFMDFIGNPLEQVFVIAGYSGCGKSYMVKHILDQLPDYFKTIKLVNPKAPSYNIVLTATTNKAAEVFSELSGQLVTTIHSVLGLRVQTDYSTGKTSLVQKNGLEPISNTILFIDEASFLDNELLRAIFKRTENCKIVFIGDPAQLAPFKSNECIVFNQNFPTARLEKVVRQAEGSAITALSAQFRDTVKTGVWTPFKPDGNEVVHCDEETFISEIEKEFSRPDWKHNDSKVLAWTNKTVIGYNSYIRNHVSNDPNICAGDYAVVNSYVPGSRQIGALKTDAVVYINRVSEVVQQYGIDGKQYTIGNSTYFMPLSKASLDGLLKQLRTENDVGKLQHIDSTWVDLRTVYSSTVDKSQGSTYDKVFIDLNDIAKCNSGNRIARMLYVAISRAKTKVYLYGDLV